MAGVHHVAELTSICLGLTQHGLAPLIDTIRQEACSMPEFDFVKSSYSNTGGQCVEVASNIADIVAVRDSKSPDSPIACLTPEAWARFTASLGRPRPA
jgi:hypothetical protein